MCNGAGFTNATSNQNFSSCTNGEARTRTNTKQIFIDDADPAGNFGPRRSREKTVADQTKAIQKELIALILKQHQLIEELRAEVEKLNRSQHRPAAPFSKGQREADPKRPGRKPGQGPFERRAAPTGRPSQTVDAEVPPMCPFCGGTLEQEGEETATTTEMPSKPEPVTTLYRVPVCRCGRCGERVRGRAAGLAGSMGRDGPPGGCGFDGCGACPAL